MNRIHGLAVAVAILVVAQTWSWLDDDGVLLPETPEAGARRWIAEQASVPDAQDFRVPKVPPLPQAGPDVEWIARDPFRRMRR